MAVRINRVEREFILDSAAETKSAARLRTAGKSNKCMLTTLSREGVRFASAADPFAFDRREIVSVIFEFRGQMVSFEAPVLKSTAGFVELGLPAAMYMNLSRKWPRVSAPKGLSVELLLPDTNRSLDFPKSGSWCDVELPELREGLDPTDLKTLVGSFKDKASKIASEGRVVMYKDRGPGDIAEEMAAKLGRTLFVPSISRPLPIADPYPNGRIITLGMVEEFEGSPSAAQDSPLLAYLHARAKKGLTAGLWCPVVYYRYTVGMVLISNGLERMGALDFGAVDLAWEISRILAWFLKRHGYFAFSDLGSREESGSQTGGIIDASPSGLLVALPDSGSAVVQNSVIRLKLSVMGETIICSGKVTRKYQEEGMRYLGIAFMNLSAQEKTALSLNLYGVDERFPLGAA